MTSPLPLRCNCRKKAQTSLRCSRCSAPICPDCSKYAPVGMICKQCASAGRSPIYQVEPSVLAKSVPVTLLAAVFGGWLVATISGIGFFAMFVSFLYGFGIGDIGMRLTGRKRGAAIEIMVGICVLIGLISGFAIHIFLPSAALGHPVPSYNYYQDEPVSSMQLITTALINPWNYASIAVGVFGAVCRIRRD